VLNPTVPGAVSARLHSHVDSGSQASSLEFVRLPCAGPALRCLVDLGCDDPPSKSLANLGELLYLGLAVALFPIIRLVVARRLNEKLVATILLTVACLVAAGIYLLVPSLPE
jgi:hypothetical protein